MDNQEINNGRRRFLTLATCGAGGVAALGVATPFVASFFPSEKAKAAGAAVEVDVSKSKQAKCNCRMAGQTDLAGQPHRSTAQRLEKFGWRSYRS